MQRLRQAIHGATGDRNALLSLRAEGKAGWQVSAAISWRDRMTAVEHELHVVVITLARVIDNREVTEAEWARLTQSLHRIEALREVRS